MDSRTRVGLIVGGVSDFDTIVSVERTSGPDERMTLYEWFDRNNMLGEHQEDERIAIRFIMDAQFEFDGAVISRVLS